jgi:hypothetical protein
MPAAKLASRRPEHEVAGRAIVKGEVVAAAHSAVVSGRGDNGLPSIASKGPGIEMVGEVSRAL